MTLWQRQLWCGSAFVLRLCGTRQLWPPVERWRVCVQSCTLEATQGAHLAGCAWAWTASQLAVLPCITRDDGTVRPAGPLNAAMPAQTWCACGPCHTIPARPPQCAHQRHTPAQPFCGSQQLWRGDSACVAGCASQCSSSTACTVACSGGEGRRLPAGGTCTLHHATTA